MSQITLNIPDAAITRIITAFCSEFQYQETLDNGTVNPETKAAFTKRMVIEYVKQVTANFEGNAAANQARISKETEINAVSIT